MIKNPNVIQFIHFSVHRPSRKRNVDTSIHTQYNVRSDIRLIDLCVLAVERDFSINFEKLMDDFANSHKDRRILLK